MTSSKAHYNVLLQIILTSPDLTYQFHVGLFGVSINQFDWFVLPSLFSIIKFHHLLFGVASRVTTVYCTHHRYLTSYGIGQVLKL